MRDYVRSLVVPMPREVWLLQAVGLAVFGTGIAIPFLVIYLHDVNGISLGVAGLVAATNGLAALLVAPAAGALADRVGARATLFAALLVLASAFALFPLVDAAWHAFLINALAGVGSGFFWPSHATLLTALAPPRYLADAFALRNVSANLAIGIGGLVGGLIARAGQPSTFTALFLLAAGVYVLFAGIVACLPSPRHADQDPEEAEGGYRAILRDRPFVWFLALNTVLLSASVGLVGLFPVFAKNEAGVSERQIGLIFFVNTILIVLLQLPITRGQEGRRRMVAFAGMGFLWAVGWLVVLAGSVWLEAAAAAALFAFGVGVLGAVGECLHGAVQGPLVAGLAPRRLLGRYTAMSTATWETAFILGPAMGGFVLQVEPYALWPIASGLCVAVAAGSLVLERRLPRDVLLTPSG